MLNVSYPCARWEPHKTKSGKNWRKCSLCGVVQEHKSKYCPNCGARMNYKQAEIITKTISTYEEPVRCKDCKYWEGSVPGSTQTPAWGECKYKRQGKPPFQFCCYGEPREVTE